MAAQPRRTPLSIPDKLPGVDFDADLAAEEAGIINIRSVYDLDGVASVNIAAVANPVHHAAGEPARALSAHRESRRDSRRGHRRSRRHGVRPEHSARHARGDRLCADRAGRLRAREGARERGARAERPRRQRPAHLGAPSELDSSRAGAGADLQRLPRAAEQSLARPQHGVQRRLRRRAEHGHRVPGLRQHVLAGRRRDDGGDAHARELPDRLRGARAERRRALHGRVDGPGRRDAGRADLVPVLEPDDAGADERQLHRRLDGALPHHHQLRDAHPSALERAAARARRHGQRRSATTPARNPAATRPSTR